MFEDIDLLEPCDLDECTCDTCTAQAKINQIIYEMESR